jgi:uncharacterized protein with NAD-binding domain and iron-sulfur cluster
LTAAFELTRPEHNGRYEVTVYQMGWRLGGKGASGRGRASRIEEHGLHLWMGFYENAFRLMRECYAERHRAFPGCRFADWQDAFKPAPDIGVADRVEDGWSFWLAHFPPGQGLPGDRSTSDPFTVTFYLRQSAMLIEELIRSAAAMESGRPEEAGQPQPTRSGAMDALADSVRALLRYGPLAGAAALAEAAGMLREMLTMFTPPVAREAAGLPIELLDAITTEARRQMQRQLDGDRQLRRVWQVIDLILAVLRGSFRFSLALDPRGFDAINDYDWREWLRMNGASEQSLNSGFMRGIYDLAFAFEDGDVSRPRLAAGVALRGAMRMFFTYRGALFWRMSAGMGDVVFAPLYQVLQERGVRFEFFHRLRNIGLPKTAAAEAPYAAELTFDVQARIRGGGEYQPLVDVHNVPSWPSSPDYEQLEDGKRFEREGRAFEASWDQRRAGVRTLRAGCDFDFVVLALSVGAVPEVAGELIAQAPAWSDMVRHVKTVSTQAFQLWLREDTAELGWPHAPANLSGFVEPFDTWAEMSHLIPEENWTEPVKSVAYFCSVLPDNGRQGAPITEAGSREQRETVRANAVGFLNRHAGTLWPNAINERGFRWSLLAAEDGASRTDDAASARFETQFWTANVNPTDRYVLSLPGSIRYRISPLDMTFDNLTIAGDWTATGLDTGCIESAVMSGRLAAHAVSGQPALEEIVGYDHP